MSRRILPRFRIGALLLLTAFCSVLMAIWSLVVQPYRDQAAAVMALRKAGAEVTLGPATSPAWQRPIVALAVGSDAFSRVVAVVFEADDAPLPDDLARRLSSLRGLERFEADRTNFDDADARGLASLKELSVVSLRYTPITDEGVASLASLPSLQTVSITGVAAGDSALAALARAPRLAEVFARWTDVTREGADAFRVAAPQCALNHHAFPASP